MGIISSKRSGPSLGYQFTDGALLRLALTHRSHGQHNNERLEFLGDSILSFVMADELSRRLPEAREGQLSRLRASLVNGNTLAEIARSLDLGEYLSLGQGEIKSGGQGRDSILADALEAVLGAIYLDGGLDPCRECIVRWFAERLNRIEPGDTHKDAKTCLQEWLQARRQPLPVYTTLAVEGEAHSQLFKVACRVSLLSKPIPGQGRSRRIAEQLAAANALKTLQEQ